MEKSVDDVVNQLKTGYRICEFLDFEKDEDRALQVIIRLIEKRVDVSQYTDKRANKGGKNALHYAVERKFLVVSEWLIRYGIGTLEQDHTPYKTRPITTAVSGDDDDLAELLVRNTEKSKVRELMARQNNTVPEINLYGLLKRKKSTSMPKTVIALLDCLQEEWRVRGKYKLYYDVLEADEYGNLPENYENNSNSALSIMARNKQKDFLQHVVVRELVKRKWQLYGKKQYRISFVLYLCTFVSLTIAMLLCVYTTDVLVYNTPMDYARAVFEVISYVGICFSLGLELFQMIKERKRYLANDKYNIFESISAALLFAALPVRFTHVAEHWYLFSVGYLFWVLRVFKYATLYKRMATYVDCLWQLVIKVFPQFAVLFIVLNLAFGGALVLGMRGDDVLEHPNETRSFHAIFLTGTRTLTSGEPMFEHDGYRSFSTVILLFFLFMILVVLLSILVAQLTEALPIASQKVDRNLTYKMARIVADIESETCDFINLLDIRFWKKKFKRGSADTLSCQGRNYTPHDVIELEKSLHTRRQSCPMVTPPPSYAPSGLSLPRVHVNPNDVSSGLPSPRDYAHRNDSPSELPSTRDNVHPNDAPSGRPSPRDCVDGNEAPTEAASQRNSASPNDVELTVGAVNAAFSPTDEFTV